MCQDNYLPLQNQSSMCQDSYLPLQNQSSMHQTVISLYRIKATCVKSLYILLYMIVIVWLLDLQLPVQSVPITTNIVRSCS
jgi:hypothetical protein